MHIWNQSQKLLALFLALALGLSCFGLLPASADESDAPMVNSTDAVITADNNQWTLDNSILTAKVVFADGSLSLTSLYNKAAQREYITEDTNNYLFSYTVGTYNIGAAATDLLTAASNDGSWRLIDQATVEDITMNESDTVTTLVGQALEITISSQTAQLTVTARFEIYNDDSGLRYQTTIQNDDAVKRVITESDVWSLSLPNESHVLHYVEAGSSTTNSNTALDAIWKSTTGILNKNTGRNALCVYDSGDGWWMMPETNWRTQIGPSTMGAKPSDTNATYEFATTTCWSGSDAVKVSTCPGSLQLTLKGGESFQYIGVNFTVFTGDVVDGKMAADLHFYRRFRFHDLTTIENSNDWDYHWGWSSQPGTYGYDYYENTIIPAAQQAKIDMVMMDDLWNVSRDSLVAVPTLKSLEDISSLIKGNGFMFGLWYSMSGDDHNNGVDLADPAALAERIASVETLITQYGLNHQMIDLTEFWQNPTETSYSSPCDNVYRKNVLLNQELNKLVEKYPQYLVKYTNEMDVYPTQGNRALGLLGLINNGWMVHAGGAGNAAPANAFGYLPLATYYASGSVNGDLSKYYFWMYARNVKLNEDPGTLWTEEGKNLLGTFNTWRHGERIEALTDGIKYPCYLGEGWDADNNEESWIRGTAATGPYAFMFKSEDDASALMIATKYYGTAQEFTADTRWLDADKTYLVADVSMTQSGSFVNAYRGVYSGQELVDNGFVVDLTESSAGVKAYWFQAVEEDAPLQVVYADENVINYDAQVNGSTLQLTVEGTPDTVANVVVASAANNTGRTLSLMIPDSGSLTVSVPQVKLYAPSEITSVDFVQRIEVENAYKDGSLMQVGATCASAPNDDSASAGASGGDYRNVSFTSAGSYISVPFTVNTAGKYLVRVAMKGHPNNALSAIGLDGVALSNTENFSDTGSGGKYTEGKITTQEYTLELVEGVNNISLICMGRGNNSATLSLRVDYFEIEPLFSDGSNPTALSFETASTFLAAGSSLNLMEKLALENYGANYAGPDSILWSVVSETNFEVAEISADGIVTGIRPGTAVLQATHKYTADSDTFILTVTSAGPADYTSVESALAQAKAIDRSQFSQTSLDLLDAAVANVVYGLPVESQNTVNAFAQAILDAIAGLENNALLGDLSKDGKLSVTDVVLLRKAILNGSTADQEPLGDLNSDSNLSVTDVVLLRKAILNQA